MPRYPGHQPESLWTAAVRPYGRNGLRPTKGPHGLRDPKGSCHQAREMARGLARMDGTQGPEGPGLVPTRGLRFEMHTEMR